MKKIVIILSSVFIVLLALGLWLNFQYGVRGPNNKFWREERAGAYSLLNGDSIKYTVEDGDIYYDLSLDGKRVTAVARTEEYQGGEYKASVEFSDGWTALLRGTAENFVSGYYNEEEIVLDDMNEMGLRFSKAVGTVREPVYSGDGKIRGDKAYLETESGERIFIGEYSHITDESSVFSDATTLTDGISLKVNRLSPDSNTKLYKNERGEYLVNARELSYINARGTDEGRIEFACFLIKLTLVKRYWRGEPINVLIYVIVYILGALTLLFPEKMAFFGRRWMYAEKPILSAAGLEGIVIAAVLSMIYVVIYMLAPAFMRL